MNIGKSCENAFKGLKFAFFGTLFFTHTACFPVLGICGFGELQNAKDVFFPAAAKLFFADFADVFLQTLRSGLRI